LKVTCSPPVARCRRLLPSSVTIFLLTAFAGLTAQCQLINQVVKPVDPSQAVILRGHHPNWAIGANDLGPIAASEPIDNLTLVLSRSPEQEQAFKKFLADQQSLGFDSYHQWLTPEQVGERFGVSSDDITTIRGWLQSQGLSVKWISPSRTFIRFGGAAGDVGRAFHTQLHLYRGQTAERLSPSSDPMVPAALQNVIKAVSGLYTIEDRPQHVARAVQADTPALTSNDGSHFITPADFATIYDVPVSLSGEGQTIGIVGRSRVNPADIANYQKLTYAFSSPQEIVPIAFGGVDPGPAYTSPPPSGVSIEDQLEATLDVTRAGGTAQNAQLLLVVATDASGGIETDAQYLVQTSPAPAQVMSISFGACELDGGPSGVAYWDTLFQQATAEGISVFVSSGDSGASGCDAGLTSPPLDPEANSPNYICSSSYATCVGGTEFNDTANPSAYWSAENSPGLGSALGYIPEGAWNEPLGENSTPQVAASGGGVSSVIPTPDWQTGTGVPSERAGRYTPDVAFSSSGHDAYFACFAAGGASCVVAANGSFQFEAFYGTSAAAPSMAGITALLGGKFGGPQGNLNPSIYQMAASNPNAFHDVTVGSSGVSNCSVVTPSMCNNSVPNSSSGSSAQLGYLITAGYDEVTGLGSLDASNFIFNFPAGPTIDASLIPQLITFSEQLVGLTRTMEITVGNSGSSALNPLSVAFTGSGAADFSADSGCQISLAPGARCSFQLTFAPTKAGTITATMNLSSTNAPYSSNISLVGGGTTQLFTPVIGWELPDSTPTSGQIVPITMVVGPPAFAPNQVTGSVVLQAGSFTSSATTVNAVNTVEIDIPAGSLTPGNNTLTATFTPDTASSAYFTSASGTTSLVVATPVFKISGASVSVAPGAITGNTATITVTPAGGFTGSVALTATIFSSPAGAQDLPVLSFGNSSPVNISGPDPGTATLTITTIASSNSASARPSTTAPWYLAGSGSLACILLIAVPRRRNWRMMIGIAGLLIAFGTGLSSCSGGGGGGQSPGGTVNPGTTPGTYILTVNATSGSVTTSNSVTLTVQ
jgi:hypothetical protein